MEAQDEVGQAAQPQAGGEVVMGEPVRDPVSWRSVRKVVSGGLGTLWRASDTALTYLLRDEFTTDDAAPITSPRTCEPGPGTFTVSDNGTNVYISSSELLIDNSSASNWADSVISGNVATVGNSAGVAAYSRCRIRSGGGFNYFATGFILDGQTNPYSGGYCVWLPRNTSELVIRNANIADASLAVSSSVGTEYKYLAILRSVGGFYVRDGKLLWVHNSRNSKSAATNLNFILATYRSDVNVDDATVLDLPANGYTAWETEFGPATAYNETPSTGATLTSEADAVHEFTWTAATGETLEWMIRRTDDSTTWSIRCDQAGSTIKTIEINSGETERASTAQTWTDSTDYRIVVTADDEEIKNYVANTAKNSYSSASFNKTATGVKITGFAAGADLVAWPRDVSSLLPAELV